MGIFQSLYKPMKYDDDYSTKLISIDCLKWIINHLVNNSEAKKFHYKNTITRYPGRKMLVILNNGFKISYIFDCSIFHPIEVLYNPNDSNNKCPFAPKYCDEERYTGSYPYPYYNEEEFKRDFLLTINDIKEVRTTNINIIKLVKV